MVKYKGKLTGVVIPFSVNSYLTLYGIGIGCSKSFIIRECVKQWKTKEEKKFPMNILLQKVMLHFSNEWKIKKNSFGKISDSTLDSLYQAYLFEVKASLTNRIETTYIDQIINSIKK